jgi:YebC/PmpR family DNA-binding regulatory protein
MVSRVDGLVGNLIWLLTVDRLFANLEYQIFQKRIRIMSGHNKWSKVKHRKGAVDAKRSKIWTKIIREITAAAKIGGDDPASNSRLRKAFEDARSNNISKDTIARAMAKGSENQEGGDYEELVYEGYGPAGVAIIVESLTDNRNRTSGDVRTVFNKNGGNLGTSGSVCFSFKKRGQISFAQSDKQNKNINEDQLLEVGIDYGIEDVFQEESMWFVQCDFEKLLTLRDAFIKAGLLPASSEVVMIPDTLVEVSGDNAKMLFKLIDALEDLDDVQHVWSNEDVDDTEMQNFMAYK